MSRSSLGAFCLFFATVFSPLAAATAFAQPAAPPADTAAAAAPAAAPPAATPAAPAAAPAASPAQPAEAATEGAAAPEGDEAAQTAEWAERDRLINESNTLHGGTGLLKTQHAQTGSPGSFRLSFITDWFSAGFLCTSSFPCPNNANPGAPITSDTMNHVGGTLALTASLAKAGAGTFDAYGSVMAYANSDSANKPALLQVLGDMNLGVKYMAPVGEVLHLGLFSELWLINGTGAVGLDGSGTSAKFGGIATADLRGLESRVPLRFSLNAVYFLDNTSDVVAPTESAPPAGRGTPVTRIERFGLGVSRVDTFNLLLGGEALLAEERVRPFIESQIAVPNNRQGYQCQPTNPSKDNCLKNDSLVPATLTLGSRFFPWRPGFSLLLAVDIGLGGVNDFIEELQPTPPWTLYLGAGWATDTWERPPVIKTKTVEKMVEKAAPRGHVVGFVHEKDKNEPIQGAILSYRDHPELSPIATGPDGKFGDDLPAGPYTYDIKAEGFKPGSCEVTVPKDAANVNVDCPLEALPRVGTVVGHVRSADNGQALGGIQVVLEDSQRKDLRLTTDPGGAFRFEGVAPGTAQLNVTAEGYLVLVEPLDVKPRQENPIDLLLRSKPKTANVKVTATEITIRQQIQFALDSAVILPESFGLLTEIADTIIRHPEIKRVEVQGHTDNSGTPDHNKVLSEQRAEAVRAWLVQHGVPSDRLVAKGYGQEKPLVPNVTAGNRAQNRRVQFIILEKEGSAPPAGPAGPTGPTGPTGPAPAPGERKKNPLPGF
jgi:outer membrane protein OmpA-like peptidoglycan-associated protein